MKDPCILGVESSCDDSSLALVNRSGYVYFEKRLSQDKIHREYGGVVPELASRGHFSSLRSLQSELNSAIEKHDLVVEKVAVTMAPGLMGSLLVGSSFAQGLASALSVPLVGVHHLRGHVASAFLQNEEINRQPKIEPSLVLLVSGGHTQVLFHDEHLNCKILAESADDAAGECLDKSAKLMGLDFPGGPHLEKLALKVSDFELAKKLSKELPTPKSEKGFSFSGLKTAIRICLEKNPSLVGSPEMAWAIEDSVLRALLNTFKKVVKTSDFNFKRVVFCGGVAANKKIRKAFEEYCERNRWEAAIAPLKFSTDNGAMIAMSAWLQADDHNLNFVEARRSLETI